MAAEPNVRARPWTRWGALVIAGVTVTAATALTVGAGTGWAIVSTARPELRASASPPPTHPGADHMGSTIRAHEPANSSAPGIRPSAVAGGQPQGMDVSGYQGNVDWSTAAANGAQFAYVKATEGTGYLNPSFGQQYNGSANAGLIRGAYHFALPDKASGADQARYFVANGGGWSPDGRTLPPMLDIEYDPYGTNSCYGLTPAQMSAWIADFSNTVSALTGRFPTIYSTTNWWNTCTGSNPNFGANNPLFIARYSSTPGAMPAGWDYQTLWQYSDTGVFPGDQDVFNGSTTQLSTFAGQAGAQPQAQDPIVAHYTAVGGSGSYLGDPVGGEYDVAGGRGQDYTGGSIFYSASTGAWAVHGAILGTYRNLGGPGGVLGFPTSDETPTPDGVGRFNAFAGTGRSGIYWTPNTGAHAVQGAIYGDWASLGYERGPLGYPTSDETPTPDGVGRFNAFAGTGRSGIYWTPNTGAHAVQGAIYGDWASLGYERGPLGYPTSDETGTPDGVGRFNAFAGTGRSGIYWTPNTGAHEVQGAIYAQWASLGYERSGLGYPTSDEYTIPGGRGNDFVHGTITWQANTGTTQTTYR